MSVPLGTLEGVELSFVFLLTTFEGEYVDFPLNNVSVPRKGTESALCPANLLQFPEVNWVPLVQTKVDLFWDVECMLALCIPEFLWEMNSFGTADISVYVLLRTAELVTSIEVLILEFHTFKFFIFLGFAFHFTRPSSASGWENWAQRI